MISYKIVLFITSKIYNKKKKRKMKNPSPKPTLTLTSQLGKNVGLWEG